jgi:hypothetical protein
VPAGANGDKQSMFASKVHGRDNVCDTMTAGYQIRPTIYHSVPDHPSGIVCFIAGLQQCASQVRPKIGDSLAAWQGLETMLREGHGVAPAAWVVRQS